MTVQSRPPAGPGERLILLTGASGSVGGRLLATLRGRGERVRCLARRPDRLRPRVGDGVEIVAGDVLDPASLAPAMAGVDTAYYLIHSMGADADFAESDRQAAHHFATAESSCCAGS